jgi:gluconokinase
MTDLSAAASKSKWIIVMGVAGAGKSSLGRVLAEKLALPFLEGDTFHPPANVAKMAAGVALNDDDRWPWLAALAAALKKSESGAVLACSALKRAYRDRLRDGAGRPLKFVWLSVSRPALNARMSARTGHYMPASLLNSQLATLERPTPDEAAITIDGDAPLAMILRDALSEIGAPAAPADKR